MELGIALDGGALRSAYFMGFFEYLYERDIKVNEIVTISAGWMPSLTHISNQSPRFVYERYLNRISPGSLKRKIYLKLGFEFFRECMDKIRSLKNVNGRLKVVTTSFPRNKPKKSEQR